MNRPALHAWPTIFSAAASVTTRRANRPGSIASRRCAMFRTPLCFAPACTLALALAAALLGCAAGPDYRAPALPEPSHFSRADPLRAYAGPLEQAQILHPGALPAARWWQAFASPALDRQVALALAASPNLASAEASVRQARAQLAQARGERWPRVDLVLNATRADPGAGGGAINSAALGAVLSVDTDPAGPAGAASNRRRRWPRPSRRSGAPAGSP